MVVWQHPVTNKQYSGAGVLLLENYKNAAGRRELAVVLFRDRGTGKYGEPGGKLDNDIAQKNPRDDSPLVAAARRETLEETAHLIAFTQDKQLSFTLPDGTPNYLDLPTPRPGVFYRLFVVLLPSGQLFRQHYRHNVRVINRSALPHDWKETNDLQRVFVNDLLAANIMTQRGALVVQSASGVKCVVVPRAKAGIREVIKAGLLQKVSQVPRPFHLFPPTAQPPGHLPVWVLAAE